MPLLGSHARLKNLLQTTCAGFLDERDSLLYHRTLKVGINRLCILLEPQVYSDRRILFRSSKPVPIFGTGSGKLSQFLECGGVKCAIYRSSHFAKELFHLIGGDDELDSRLIGGIVPCMPCVSWHVDIIS